MAGFNCGRKARGRREECGRIRERECYRGMKEKERNGGFHELVKKTRGKRRERGRVRK